MTQTTFLDITQLVHWPGQLTGIPRVMNELALRYAGRSDTRFIVWDGKEGCFFELDGTASLQRRGKGIFYAAQNGGTANASYRPVHSQLRDRVKYVASGLKRRNPQLYKRLSARFNDTVPGGPAKGPAIVPQSGDRLLVLWGEWGDATYRSHLARLNDGGVALSNIVYDMLPVLTPQYSGHSTQAMNDFYREIIPRCEIVFSISESTKRDLSAWLKDRDLRVPPIAVFRLGDDFTLSKSVKPESEHFRKTIGADPFILCVGTIEARKNHTLLYYVYKLALRRGIDLPKLVIVGRRGYRADNIYDLITNDPETKDRMIPMIDMSDEELSWLYANCLFSIYPSFYEGWGLPIAESISYGKVCLSSDTSSMPEVAGDLVPYFSPLSSDECLDAIAAMMDPKLRRAAEKRLKTYKITTWDTTFKQVEHGFKELTR